jgi:PAS domain S-box-containing protein
MAERNLEAAEALLLEQSQMLEHAREAIVVHELDRTIRYWNRGAERIFGYTREQALGRTFGALMGAAATLPDAAEKILMQTGEWAGEVECVDASGRMLTVQRHCSLLRDAQGLATAMLSTNVDVTERHRAEKEIVLLNNVLEQRIRRRTTELEESNEDLRDFAYSLAHDLRSPLASIDGFSAQLEMTLAGRLDERSRHYLGRVRAGVKLMSDLTDALLGLANLSNTELSHQDVDLSSVAGNVFERLREGDPRREVAVVIGETPLAHGDARLLTGVLQNLLGNAWKFTSKTPGARIEFGGQQPPGGAYQYRVSDNGAGFDPAYSHKLFAPFQRLHAASEFEGTGIGLAMVRKIVSRHGGRVWAESRPGEGASFYFTLNEGLRAVTAARGEPPAPAAARARRA